MNISNNKANNKTSDEIDLENTVCYSEIKIFKICYIICIFTQDIYIYIYLYKWSLSYIISLNKSVAKKPLW